MVDIADAEFSVKATPIIALHARFKLLAFLCRDRGLQDGCDVRSFRRLHEIQQRLIRIHLRLAGKQLVEGRICLLDAQVGMH